jgi:hypothetical protein
VAINVITALAFSLAATAIFWGRSHDRMIVPVSAARLTIGVEGVNRGLMNRHQDRSRSTVHEGHRR